MTSLEISKLPSGTEVYLVQNRKISKYIVFGSNPNHEKYFYFISNSNVEDTFCIYLDEKNSSFNLFWEIDYEKAKEEMWNQLQKKLMSIK